MKKSFMLAAALVLLLTGCDNLASAPQDPLISPRVDPNASMVKPKGINRASMEEAWRYAANIHDTMRKYRDVLLSTPRDSDGFMPRKNVFVSETAQWRHLLYVRMQWMKEGDFDDSHPSRKIHTAIYYLVEESKHLDSVFSFNTPLDPSFGENTDKAFEESLAALRQYQDSPGP